MKSHRKSGRFLTALLSLAATASLVQVGNATTTTEAVSIANMAGPWVIALTGVTGCGVVTSRATGTLNSLGTGTFTLTSHSAGCGDVVSTENFTIQTLAVNGNGKAGLTCNNQSGCGWILAIQVEPNRATFNLVDLTDPGNYLEGTAVRQ